MLKALNDYVFKIEDFHDLETEEIYGTSFKYYADDSLDKQEIFSNVLAFEKGMPVWRLMKLVTYNGTLNLHIRWKGLPPSDNTMEQLSSVYDNVLQLVVELLGRENTPADLCERAWEELGLEKGVCNDKTTDASSLGAKCGLGFPLFCVPMDE